MYSTEKDYIVSIQEIRKYHISKIVPNCHFFIDEYKIWSMEIYILSSFMKTDENYSNRKSVHRIKLSFLYGYNKPRNESIFLEKRGINCRIKKKWLFIYIWCTVSFTLKVGSKELSRPAENQHFFHKEKWVETQRTLNKALSSHINISWRGQTLGLTSNVYTN